MTKKRGGARPPKFTPDKIIEVKNHIREEMIINPTSNDTALVAELQAKGNLGGRAKLRKLIKEVRAEQNKYMENIEIPYIVGETVNVFHTLERHLIGMVVDESLPAGVRSYCAMTLSMVRKQLITILVDTGTLAKAPKAIALDGIDLDQLFNGKEKGDPDIMSKYTVLIDTVLVKAGLKSKNELRRSNNSGPKRLKSG